jgi:uncharacterized protein (TIGR00255 family)
MNRAIKPAVAASAVRSMTGYAEARAEHDGWSLRVSLRSVNHRFLDLRVRIPDGFEALEPVIRQSVRDHLRRGHVEVTLHVDTARKVSIEVHREVAAAYLGALEELRRDFGLAPGPELIALLRLPGVVAAGGALGAASSNAALDEDALESLGTAVSACLGDALRKLDQMRELEGQSLADEMLALVAAIREKTASLDQLTERSRPAYAQRLKERVEEMLGAASVDPSRLAQEAALLAERADVSEELVRLRSHVEQFGNLVAAAGELGKKLDFLLQEMQREANTFLSKTPGLGEDGLAMTGLGLQIKSDIEKLREQVQNVE